MKLLLLLFFLAATLISCYDCGPKAEPTLNLSVEAATHTLQKVTALGAISDLAFQSFQTGKDRGFGEVPLSLLQDSTTYLFYFEDRVDTLTLFYRRIFDVRRECGYYMDIAPPAGRRFRSTFSQTEVSFSPYTGEVKGFYTTAYGISLRVARF
jgi:hypothetical protein